MASPELRRLWRLHQIDERIGDIRKRAAGLDPGRAIQAELNKLNALLEEQTNEAKRLHGETTDLELLNKGIGEKIAKIEKELFGSLLSPRDVELMTKESVALKARREENDMKLLELWEQLPPAQEKVAEIEKKVAAAKQQLTQSQKKALEEKQKLEGEFKQVAAERPAAVKEVPEDLLKRYDAIMQRYHTSGMGQIDRGGRCMGCGSNLPGKVVEAAKDDRTVTCENCHRILYWTDGIV